MSYFNRFLSEIFKSSVFQCENINESGKNILQMYLVLLYFLFWFTVPISLQGYSLNFILNKGYSLTQSTAAARPSVQLTWPFIRLFISSFFSSIRSLARWLVGWPVRSFVRSLARSFVCSFACLFVGAFIYKQGNLCQHANKFLPFRKLHGGSRFVTTKF